MNPTNLFLAAGTLLLFSLSACGKSEPQAPSPPSPPNPPSPPVETSYVTLTGTCSSGKVSTGSGAASIQVTFDTNENWNASLPASVADWCAISPASGTKGSGSITVTIAENTFYDERNATLTIKAGKATANVVIAQKQLDALLVSSAKVEIEQDGGNFDIEVKSNVGATYEIPTQYVSWLRSKSGKDSRGLSSSVFAFVVDANESGKSREGEIVFSGGSLRESVKVYQPWGPVILVSEPKKYIGATGGDIVVEVQSNTEFTYIIAEGAEWLHRNESRAMSSHTLYFTADPYEGTEAPRYAKIEFTVAGSPIAEMVVEQQFKGAVLVGSRSLEVPAQGGEYTLSYMANRPMSLRLPSWIVKDESSTYSRSMDAYSLAIKVMPNVSLESREAMLVLYDAGDEAVKDSVLVKQDGHQFSYTTSIREKDFMDARSHEFTIDVNTTADYEVVLPEPMKHIEGNRYFLPANHVKGLSGMRSIFMKVNGNIVATLPVYYSEPHVGKLEESEVELLWNVGVFAIDIETNTDIECNIDASAPWLRLKSANTALSGQARDSWEFSVEENTAAEPRSAVVHFSAGDFWSASLSVRQSGKPVPPQSSESVTLESEGSLSDALGENYLDIEELIVAGGVNGKDVATMRRMATEGKLTDIDISDVTLLKDMKNEYYQGWSYPGKITEDYMVGNWMFYKTRARHVILPKNLKKLGYKAFAESAIEKIDIPDGAESADYGAFKDCASLSAAEVPGSMTEIPEQCFFNCPRLSEVVLSEGILKIGEHAFAPSLAYSDDSRIRDIKLPSTLQEIGKGAFVSTKIKEIIIPASVTKIGENAFMYCRNLRKAVFECSLDTLSAHILENCVALTELEFPKGLKVIGENALTGIGTERLVIPEGVTEIMKGSLNGAGIYGIELPESLEIIGDFALGYLSLAQSFTIPAGVKRIGYRAFDGTCSITELHIKCLVPPKRGGVLFSSSFKIDKCTLYVPKGTADAYKSDTYWLKFKEIIEE